MYRNTRSILIFLFLLQAFTALAQSGSSTDYNRNSPYSRFGLGDFILPGAVRNLGMGGTGVSHSNPEFYNNLNPALLINKRTYHYDSLFSILDGSMFGELRTARDNNAKQTSGTVNFNGFAYALPVSRRWTASVSLRPFTDVSYSTRMVAPVSGTSDSAATEFTGSGGLYQAEFSNGIRINRYLSVGISASYLFGGVNHRSLSYLINIDTDSTRAGINYRTYYSGMLVRPGAVFRIPVTHHQTHDSTIFFNLGVTYDFYSGMKGQEKDLVERWTKYNILISQNEVMSATRHITLPGTLKFGMSLDKGYRWNVAADFAFSNWKNYKGVNTSDMFTNSFTASLGGELGFVMPKFRDESEEIKRVRRNYVRAGFIYSATPLYVQDQQIKDMAVTFGYSFNVGKVTKTMSGGIPRSKVNLAVVIGQRGTLKEFLIREQYIRGYLGLTINEKWFRRKRVE